MINNVFNRVAQLGIDTSKFDPVPAMALGFDISVHDIVSAIAPFANHGIYNKPVYLLRMKINLVMSYMIISPNLIKFGTVKQLTLY